MKLRDAVKRGRVDLAQPEIAGASKEELTQWLRLVSGDFHTIPKKPAHVELAKALIDAGALPDEEMIHQASRSGYLDTTDLLANNLPGESIYAAAALGHSAQVEHYLKSDQANAERTDLNGRTALHFCCASALGKQDIEIRDALSKTASILIDGGSPPDPESNCCGLDSVTPLFHACWTSGDLEIVLALLKRGAEPTERCLWAAVGHFQRHGNGSYGIAEELLNRGIDINHFDASGRTMLHAFAAHEDERGVRWLLEHGADVGARDTSGMTPLHVAFRRNTGVRTVGALLEHGADPKLRDNDGKTPLDLASEKSRHKIVKLLEN
jgi:ankyrin repeat protein